MSSRGWIRPPRPCRHSSTRWKGTGTRSAAWRPGRSRPTHFSRPFAAGSRLVSRILQSVPVRERLPPLARLCGRNPHATKQLAVKSTYWAADWRESRNFSVVYREIVPSSSRRGSSSSARQAERDDSPGFGTARAGFRGSPANQPQHQTLQPPQGRRQIARPIPDGLRGEAARFLADGLGVSGISDSLPVELSQDGPWKDAVAPPAGAAGAGRRVLAVISGEKSPADWQQELEAALGDCVTLQPVAAAPVPVLRGGRAQCGRRGGSTHGPSPIPDRDGIPAPHPDRHFLVRIRPEITSRFGCRTDC